MATGFERYGKKTKRALFLEEMEQVVPWAELCGLIEPHYPRAGNGWPPVGGCCAFTLPRPSAVAGKTDFTYTGVNFGIPVDNAPNILHKDFIITANITVPSGGAEGIIATMGGRFEGRLFPVNGLADHTAKITSPREATPTRPWPLAEKVVVGRDPN